jgi:hypothetical protein
MTKEQTYELNQKQSELLALLIQPTQEQKRIAARLFEYLMDEEIEPLITALQNGQDGKEESFAVTCLLRESMWKLLNASTKEERQALGWDSLTPNTIPDPDWSAHDLVLGRTPPKTLPDRVMRFLATRLTERQFVRLVGAFLGGRRDRHVVELERK